MIRTPIESDTPPQFKPGDKVMLKTRRFMLKKMGLQTEWTGPFEILSIGPDGYAKVRDKNKWVHFAHFDRMKRAEEPSRYRVVRDNR